jgi:hypothetical protein
MLVTLRATSNSGVSGSLLEGLSYAMSIVCDPTDATDPEMLEDERDRFVRLFQREPTAVELQRYRLCRSSLLLRLSRSPRRSRTITATLV